MSLDTSFIEVVGLKEQKRWSDLNISRLFCQGVVLSSIDFVLSSCYAVTVVHERRYAGKDFMTTKQISWWLGLALLLSSLVAFFIPLTPGSAEFTWQDKLIHFAVFTTLAGCFLLARPRWRPLIIGLLLAYAIDSEIIQELFIPGRTFQWSDLLADALGILGGDRLIAYVHHRH